MLMSSMEDYVFRGNRTVFLDHLFDGQDGGFQQIDEIRGDNCRTSFTISEHNCSGIELIVNSPMEVHRIVIESTIGAGEDRGSNIHFVDADLHPSVLSGK